MGRTDLAREHRAAVDADLDRQRRIVLNDLAQCEQHPLLILAYDPWSAGAQPDLGAVGGDVGVQEADVVAFGRVLDESHELIESLGGGVRPLFGNQLIEPPELKERDRRGPVLRRGMSAQQMRADCRRQAVRDRLVRWPPRRLGGCREIDRGAT